MSVTPVGGNGAVTHQARFPDETDRRRNQESGVRDQDSEIVAADVSRFDELKVPAWRKRMGPRVRVKNRLATSATTTVAL
jgi:hypothetical protein